MEKFIVTNSRLFINKYNYDNIFQYIASNVINKLIKCEEKQKQSITLYQKHSENKKKYKKFQKKANRNS